MLKMLSEKSTIPYLLSRLRLYLFVVIQFLCRAFLLEYTMPVLLLHLDKHGPDFIQRFRIMLEQVWWSQFLPHFCTLSYTVSSLCEEFGVLLTVSKSVLSKSNGYKANAGFLRCSSIVASGLGTTSGRSRDAIWSFLTRWNLDLVLLELYI